MSFWTSVVAGGHERLAQRALEVHLAHGLVERGERQLEQPERVPARVDVGLGVLAEDLEQAVAVGEQLAGGELLLRLAQELLLAGAANEVVVLVAEAHVGERVVAAELLVARVEVDVGVLDPGRLVAAVHVRVHASEPVHDLDEPAEVHVDHVVDPQAGELLDRVHHQLGAAVGVGVVQLAGALARDLHLEVARERHQRGGALGRVEPDQDHGVGAGVAELARLGLGRVRALVGPEQHDRLRLAGLGLRQRLAEVELRSLPERVHELVELVERQRRRAGRAGEHDQQRAGHDPLPEARVASARQAMRSLSTPSASGTMCTKSTSARR